jgi:hypothetical protein
MNMAAIWDVAPCNLVQIVRRFIGTYSIIMAMIHRQTTRRNIPEDSHLPWLLFLVVVNIQYQTICREIKPSLCSSHYAVGKSFVPNFV